MNLPPKALHYPCGCINSQCSIIEIRRLSLTSLEYGNLREQKRGHLGVHFGLAALP
jgi:hypothetical protein